MTNDFDEIDELIETLNSGKEKLPVGQEPKSPDVSEDDIVKEINSSQKKKPSKKKKEPIIDDSDIQDIEIEKYIEEVDDDKDSIPEFVYGLLDKFGKTSDDIVSRFKEDRDELQKVIDLFMRKVINDPDPPRVIVESLTLCLRTKADTNANTTRVLDSICRLISAGKSFGPQGGGGQLTEKQLRAILEDSDYDED